MHLATMGAMLKVCNKLPDDLNDNLRLLKDGRWYEPQMLPRKYAYGEMKQCFANAARLALREPTLTYVEGFAHSGLIPVHHAWTVDLKGRVIDPTWRTRPEDEYAHKVHDMAYLGIEFEIEEAVSYLLQGGSCLFDWRRLSKSLDEKAG